VAEVAKKHGISDVTIYAWRKRFGKLESVDVKRLRQIESENARPKKLLAERARAPSAGRVRSCTRRIDPASVRADVSGEIHIAVRVTGCTPTCEVRNICSDVTEDSYSMRKVRTP
jgi:hypothetical protein